MALMMKMLAKEAHAMRSSDAAPRPPRQRRRRIPLTILLLAAVGLVTVFVLAMRYAIVPLLVLLGGMA